MNIHYLLRWHRQFFPPLSDRSRREHARSPVRQQAGRLDFNDYLMILRRQRDSGTDHYVFRGA